MSDRETESFTPYEPQPTYDWDVAEEKPERPNILWGRAVVLGAVLLIAFFIGRASAPNGTPKERVTALQRENNNLQNQVDELKAALSAQPSPSPSVTVGGGGDDTTDTTVNATPYVVQSGDTLRDIADRFCHDPTKADLLADFNGLDDPSSIRPGDELQIPDDCGK